MTRSARLIHTWKATATNPNFLWPEDITNKHRQSKIIAVVPNPKTEGKNPWRRFNCYRVGMIGKDYIDAVVSKRVGNEGEAVADLAWDNNRYYIRCEEHASGDSMPIVQRDTTPLPRPPANPLLEVICKLLLEQPISTNLPVTKQIGR